MLPGRAPRVDFRRLQTLGLRVPPGSAPELLSAPAQQRETMTERPTGRGRLHARRARAASASAARAHALTTPIYQTSTFWFRDSAELRELRRRAARSATSTAATATPPGGPSSASSRELEGAEEAVLFASGMCAATTTFLALLPARRPHRRHQRLLPAHAPVHPAVPVEARRRDHGDRARRTPRSWRTRSATTRRSSSPSRRPTPTCA